jgi:hypothetical protein
MSHGHDAPPAFDPATAPHPDESGLTGAQLIALMGAALLAALIFLDIVSG